MFKDICKEEITVKKKKKNKSLRDALDRIVTGFGSLKTYEKSNCSII